MARSAILLAALWACGVAAPASATEATATGRVLQAQGHQNAACRMLYVRENGAGRMVLLRIPNTGSDNSILSVALTALTSGHSVLVDYDTAITTGAGRSRLLPGFPCSALAEGGLNSPT